MPASLGPYNGITWNWDDYDAVDNPYGLGNGGFREDTGLPLLLASFLLDAGMQFQMSATDTLAITGSASRVFTPATMRGVQVGQFMQATYNASNWMWGQITAVSATQVTILMSQSYGAGSYSAWTLNVTGPQAPAPTVDEGQLVLLARAMR